MRSEPGKGTFFEILFPRIKRTNEHTIIGSGKPAGGTERILFVDDEETIADLGGRMLVQLGYHVTSMTESRKAIELFRAEPGAFDIVITDYTMPHLTGVDLAKEILQIRPDIPIVLCTGYSEMINDDIAKKRGISAFVMKPLSLRDVAKLIREVLDKKRT